MFANNAQVEIIEAEDADYHYKTLTAISTTGAVQKKWQTPRTKRVRQVLPSLPDSITGSQKELPITPTFFFFFLSLLIYSLDYGKTLRPRRWPLNGQSGPTKRRTKYKRKDKRDHIAPSIIRPNVGITTKTIQ